MKELLSKDSLYVAQHLIGSRLYVIEQDGSKTGGVISETEAYNQDDAASHSCRGPTLRTEVMFGPAGKLYVYFTYGMHWCMNIVTGPVGRGEAVLIRAIEPDQGLEKIRDRRGNVVEKNLTNGPAKLCQALSINNEDSGADINSPRFSLESPNKTDKRKIIATERIGISKDKHRLWRFTYDD
ncbi:DNA-3-methyladenine glycosylase [Candidatus Saccharibacteria bacterium]|jgi:DNA-3-methyladenine glycosylase|nr:DNA-3-methyladenine glycosylase [Candidatus Saccharibacteria bacterium]